MKRGRRERIILWTAIFGWPIAILIGWALDHLTNGRLPMALCPLAWVFAMGAAIVLLRRRERQTNFSR